MVVKVRVYYLPEAELQVEEIQVWQAEQAAEEVKQAAAGDFDREEFEPVDLKYFVEKYPCFNYQIKK